jgi:hypothetical protein
LPSEDSSIVENGLVEVYHFLISSLVFFYTFFQRKAMDGRGRREYEFFLTKPFERSLIEKDNVGVFFIHAEAELVYRLG